jgi:formiminotetrahydrofolate cyclodeaminase
MVVSISSIDILDLFSAMLSAVGGGGIGAVVSDSRLGSSLSKIPFSAHQTLQISLLKNEKIGALVRSQFHT